VSEGSPSGAQRGDCATSPKSLKRGEAWIREGYTRPQGEGGIWAKEDNLAETRAEETRISGKINRDENKPLGDACQICNQRKEIRSPSQLENEDIGNDHGTSHWTKGGASEKWKKFTVVVEQNIIEKSDQNPKSYSRSRGKDPLQDAGEKKVKE